MGLFDLLFGKKESHPSLDPAGEAAAWIAARREQLEPFVRKIHDRIELVPAEEAVYAYIGKPPGVFGMAWFENGGEVGFRSLVQDHGLSQRRIRTLSARLGSAYGKSTGAARYATTIAGKEVLVTPCASLAEEIRWAIHEAVS